MALGLLCLGLILTGALKIQAQDSLPTFIPSPPLGKVPLLPGFQYDQFQGKWYSVGWAENRVGNGSQSKAAIHSATYKLNDDHSYNVTSDWLSNQGCVQKFTILFPSDQPRQFTMGNMTNFEGLQNFTMRVLETDYNQFAMLYLKMTFDETPYEEHILYGRTMELKPVVREHYCKVTWTLGIPEDQIMFTNIRVDCTGY